MSVETTPTPQPEVEWNLGVPIRALVRGWGFITLCTLAGVALAVVISLLIKPWYVADAVFLPPKAEPAANEPLSLLLGTNDISDSYLGMLGSRTVADEVIDRLNLVAVYKVKLRTDARSVLGSNSKFTVNKNSLISVSVTDHDPKLAANIANAYLDALYRLNGQMVSSASDHRRMFFEDQLSLQKAALTAAENDLKATEQTTGVVLPANEAQADLTATAQLQAEINAVETRLAGLLSGETEQNPQVVEARSQLRQLQAQLASQVSPTNHQAGGLKTSRQLPDVVQQSAEKEREVKLRETVYDALVGQYERARLAAADPGPQLQVVDRAVEPERKAGPPRTLIVIGGAAIGLTFGALWVLFGQGVRSFIATLREPEKVGKG